MTKLKYEDCPDVSRKRVDSVNELSDSELLVEIERGRDSRFKEAMIPVLKLALKKRNEIIESQKREEELNISRKSNEIANAALEQAQLANRKSDQTRIWSAVAVLVTVIIAAIGWLKD